LGSDEKLAFKGATHLGKCIAPEGNTMRNMWLVIKHDIRVILQQRSFWIMTLIVPLVLIGFQAWGATSQSGLLEDMTAPAENEATSIPTTADGLPIIGLVDKGQLIQSTPPDFPSDAFIHFADEGTARAALDADEIVQYVVIPANYVETGQLQVFDKDFRILMEGGPEMGVAFDNNGENLQFLINYNLVEDAQFLRILANPLPFPQIEAVSIQPEAAAVGAETAVNHALAATVSSVMPYIFYFLLLMSSSYMMRSVVAEKENRTVEVLLTSMNARTLMIGKLMAMSAIVLIQVIVWIGGSVLILQRGANLLELAAYEFPPGFFIWALLFLLTGYLLFASIMSATGAIANNIREGGQVTWLLVIPLMPTLMFGRLFVEDPNGLLPMILSMFPLSAPSAMVTRLAVAEVPFWQLIVSLAGVSITAYIFVMLSARFFQSQNLLSQQAFDWRRLATGWRK